MVVAANPSSQWYFEPKRPCLFFFTLFKLLLYALSKSPLFHPPPKSQIPIPIICQPQTFWLSKPNLRWVWISLHVSATSMTEDHCGSRIPHTKLHYRFRPVFSLVDLGHGAGSVNVLVLAGSSRLSGGPIRRYRQVHGLSLLRICKHL